MGVLVMSTRGWRKMYLAVVLAAILHCSSAQVGQEIDKVLCAKREAHWTFKGRAYVYSGFATDFDDEEEKTVLPGTNGKKNYTGVVRDFGNAVRHCTLRCMALVSLETEDEWDFIREKMEEVEAPFVWTSGHKCDKTVSNRCYSEPSIQPRIINSWFWSGSGQRIPATNKIPPGWSKSPWGTTGIYTKVNQQKDKNAPPVPQPDNAEQDLKLLKKEEESCIALATDLWEPGTVWNDIACYHEKPWICEENAELLKRAGIIN